LTALLDAREQIVELYDQPSYLSGFAYLDGSRDRVRPLASGPNMMLTSKV